MSSLILAAATPYGLHAEVWVPVRTYHIHGGLYAPVAREVLYNFHFWRKSAVLGSSMAPGGTGVGGSPSPGNDKDTNKHPPFTHSLFHDPVG